MAIKSTSSGVLPICQDCGRPAAPPTFVPIEIPGHEDIALFYAICLNCRHALELAVAQHQAVEEARDIIASTTGGRR